MTLTCACGAPARTAPVVEDASGPLCDRCVSRVATPAARAKIDQASALAREYVGQAADDVLDRLRSGDGARAGATPDEAAGDWLRSGLAAYFAAGHHDELVPMTQDDRFRFFVWAQQVDPGGWARHRATLLGEAS